MINGIGERSKQKFDMRADEPKYRTQPIPNTAIASQRVIFPLGNSRFDVLGFLRSISRSIMRFKANAVVRAPTAAIKINNNRLNDGNLCAPSTTPLYISGSVNNVCSIFTKFRNFLKMDFLGVFLIKKIYTKIQFEAKYGFCEIRINITKRTIILIISKNLVILYFQKL